MSIKPNCRHLSLLALREPSRRTKVQASRLAIRKSGRTLRPAYVRQLNRAIAKLRIRYGRLKWD